MPDAPRPHNPKRTRAAGPRRPSDRAGPLPCVVGALLGAQPEETLLLKAAASTARIELVAERLALLSTLLAVRPGALVLPPFDAHRISTAPLVLRVRREAPAVAVVVLAAHPAGAGQPMLRAVQAGAMVLASPSLEQLRQALTDVLAEGKG